MRIFLLLILLAANCLAEGAFGVWKVNPIRSTNPYPESLTVQFEPHAKGEVFTLDRIGGDGRTMTSSTIVPRRQARRFAGRGVFGHPIIASSGQPDCGDSAPVRER